MFPGLSFALIPETESPFLPSETECQIVDYFISELYKGYILSQYFLKDTQLQNAFLIHTMMEQKTTLYFDFMVLKNPSSISVGMELPVSVGTVDVGKHNFW